MEPKTIPLGSYRPVPPAQQQRLVFDRHEGKWRAVRYWKKPGTRGLQRDTGTAGTLEMAIAAAFNRDTPPADIMRYIRSTAWGANL